MQVSVSRATSTMRSRGRTLQRARGRDVTAHASKRELVSADLSAAGVARPNTVMTARVTVRNSAEVIAGDEDGCSSGPVLNGYRLETSIKVDGEVVETRSNCIRGLNGSKEYTFDVTTPTDGDSFELAYEVTGESSGRTVASGSQRVELREEAPGQGDDRDGGGPMLPCFIDPNRSCSGGDAVGFSALAALAIPALALLVV